MDAGGSRAARHVTAGEATAARRDARGDASAGDGSEELFPGLQQSSEPEDADDLRQPSRLVAQALARRGALGTDSAISEAMHGLVLGMMREFLPTGTLDGAAARPLDYGSLRALMARR
jgi:hypothetical protein